MAQAAQALRQVAQAAPNPSSAIQRPDYRTGGMITDAARHLSRSASAEHARALRARSKHTCTSRNRGAPWLEQVATTESAGHCGFAFMNAFTMTAGDFSTALVGPTRGFGIATAPRARRTSAK